MRMPQVLTHICNTSKPSKDGFGATDSESMTDGEKTGIESTCETDTFTL